MVSDDPSTLTDEFEIDAFQSYDAAPPRSWSFDSWELEGDLHVNCFVRLDNADAGVAALYSVVIGPASVVETPDGYVADPANPERVVKSIEYGP